MQSRVQKSPTNRMVKLLMVLTRYRVVLYASPLTCFTNAGSKQREPRGTTSVYEECGNVSFCFPPPDFVSARSPLIENFRNLVTRVAENAEKRQPNFEKTNRKSGFCLSEVYAFRNRILLYLVKTHFESGSTAVSSYVSTHMWSVSPWNSFPNPSTNACIPTADQAVAHSFYPRLPLFSWKWKVKWRQWGYY